MRLEMEDVRFRYGATPVLKGVTIAQLTPGTVTAVIGPNAAGKTTLLKCLAGVLRPEGRVVLGGQDISRLKRAEATRHVSYLPQETPVNAVLTVFEAVLLARQHSASWRVGDGDLTAVAGALERLEIADLALRYLNELSGGQKQVVSVAQALARDPSVLLMDEPTSSLDLQRQLEVLDLVREVTRERGITTLIALHDLNMAARYADRFVVLNDGVVYAEGSAAAVLTPEMLRDVYGVYVAVSVDGDGVPQLTPLASVRRKTPPATE